MEINTRAVGNTEYMRADSSFAFSYHKKKKKTTAHQLRKIKHILIGLAARASLVRLLILCLRSRRPRIYFFTYIPTYPTYVYQNEYWKKIQTNKQANRQRRSQWQQPRTRHPSGIYKIIPMCRRWRILYVQ